MSATCQKVDSRYAFWRFILSEMHELLPIVLGAIAGGIAIFAPLPKPRALWFMSGTIIAGALASWINGGAASALWPLFVSCDALLAWLGAIGYVAAIRFFHSLAWPHG